MKSQNIDIVKKKYLATRDHLGYLDSTKRVVKPEDFYFDPSNLLNIYIEPTNRCNVRCSFCARENMQRPITTLSSSQAKEIIDAMPKNSYITITGNGEPLLFKGVYEMISYASQSNHIVSIITNGTALNKNNRMKLANSGVSRVMFSFDSIIKNVYEETRKGAIYEKTLNNILLFIKIVRENNIPMFIANSSVQTKAIKVNAGLSKLFWNNMPINYYYEGELLSLQNNSKAYGEISIKEEEPYKMCTVPWLTVKINSDGNVNPCPQDFTGTYSIGNIFKNSLNNIVNSDKALWFRKAIYEGDLSYLHNIGYNCYECNTWRNGTGYNISEFLENTLPKRLSLVEEEVSVTFSNKKYSLHKLEEALMLLENHEDMLTMSIFTK